MINIIKKILFLTLLVLILFFSGYFLYKSYTAYQNYQIAKESEKYTLFIKNLNTALKKVEQESSLSALYLGTKGDLNFNQLKNIREKTDNSVRDIIKFIKNNPKFSSYNENIVRLPKNLQYVRSRVDVLSQDYKDILFTYYQNEISNSLLNVIEDSANKLSFGVTSLKKYLISYVEFVKFRNSIEKEKSFITFIITLPKKMDRDDLVLWDKMLAQEIIPKFNNLNSKTTKTIRQKLQPEKFFQLNFNIRVDIAKGANRGYYSTDISRWLEDMDEKIKRVEKSEDIIFKYLKDKTSNIEFSPKKIILYISFSLSLLFLLLSLLSMKKSNKNRKIDIKNISIDDRREINKHISHSNNMFHSNLNLDKKDNNFTQTPTTLPKTANQSKAEVSEVKTFDAFKEFNSIIEFFSKTTKKDIRLNYHIDPTIPTSCIGDFSKIKEILEYIIEYAIKSTKAYNSVEIHINSSAENEKESAINFKITAPNCYINKKQKQIIMKAFYQKSIPLPNKIESDLILTSKLISSIDGVFGIDSDLKEGTIFSFTLSIQKSTS